MGISEAKNISPSPIPIIKGLPQREATTFPGSRVEITPIAYDPSISFMDSSTAKVKSFW
ncbi:hypothetical protein ES705_44388 [subsurface metagenome]